MNKIMMSIQIKIYLHNKINTINLFYRNKKPKKEKD